MAKKILIIDDDPNIVQYMENLFRDNGYEPISASDGGEALRMLKEDKPDLITLDLDMPDVYGTKFFRSLRKDEAYSHIPVIVVSGITHPERAIKKVVAVFEKPFDAKELVAAVKNTLGE